MRDRLPCPHAAVMVIGAGLLTACAFGQDVIPAQIPDPVKRDAEQSDRDALASQLIPASGIYARAFGYIDLFVRVFKQAVTASDHDLEAYRSELQQVCRDKYRSIVPVYAKQFPAPTMQAAITFFMTDDGKALTDALALYRYDPKKIWNMVLEKAIAAGTKAITPHGMRHSFASNLLMGGAADWMVARWLGHADTSMVNQTYGHLVAYHGDINRWNPAFGVAGEAGMRGFGPSF